MEENGNENMEREKIDNLKYYQDQKLLENKNIAFAKSEYQTKIQKARNDLSALIKERPISSNIRNYDTHDLISYIQNNNNNYINNAKTSNNNSCDKNKVKNKRYYNKMNNYLDKSPINLGIKTENNNNKNNPKKQNSQLLIEIMNSNSNKNLNKINSKNKDNLPNEDYMNKNKRIKRKINGNDVEYSKTEALNLSNDRSPNYIYKNNKDISWKNNKNNQKFIESSKRNKKILNSNNKRQNNNIIINVSNNNLFNNANRLYINNKTSSNSINNYFKIKNMNLHFLSEVHHSPTEINVLTNLNQDDSFKKLKLNISGDLLFKQKIKNDLDPIKKNKELSQKLEDTSKELDKMHNIRKKYISSINKILICKKNLKI